MCGTHLLHRLRHFTARTRFLEMRLASNIIGDRYRRFAVTGPVLRAEMSVAVIEARDLGGTCPNRGCTPKKILVAAGHALHEIERTGVHQVALGKPKLDWPTLIDRKTAMIKDIPGIWRVPWRSGR